MEKYIIELPENTHWIQWIMESTKDHHPYMDYKQVEDLIPYTEDSAYAHGYTEAESKYREIRDELEKQAYQRGYEDAKHECEDCAKNVDFDAIRKEAYQRGHKDGYNKHDTERIRKREYDKGLDDIGNALRLLLFQYSNYTLQEIFGYDTARAVVEHFEGSEIVARIRCYEGGVKQDVETIRKEAFEKGYSTAVAEQECAVRGAEEKGYQRGYKEAYDTAYADAEEIYESGKRAMYQKGLKDAWEAARKIYGSATKHGLPTEVITRIFRDDGKENFNYWDIVEDFSPAEAIEKIRQYEQKQEESEEPKKEQSVTVEEVMRQYLNTFCHGRSCMSCPLNAPNFTCGRGYHFITNPVSDEEVRRAYTTVLQKMKEN